MPVPTSPKVVVPLGELGTEPFGAGSSGVGKPANTPPAPVVTASPTLDPLRYPEAWTYVKASGVRSPGHLPPPEEGGMSGFEREEKWDVKAGKGTQGATTTHVALEPAKGSFTFHLWKVDHYAAWDAWLALFKFDASKKTGQAVQVYHPALASVQPPITSVVMTKHSAVRPDAKGLAKVTIELLEYFPSKATGTSTAKGAQQFSQVGKDKKGQQEDPAIAALRAQAAALAKQAGAVAGP